MAIKLLQKKIVTSEGVKEHLYNYNFIIDKDEKYLFPVEDGETITEKFLNRNYSTDGFDKIKREIMAYALVQKGNIDLLVSHLKIDDVTNIIDVAKINNCYENTTYLLLKNKHLREIIKSSKSERLDIESLKNIILIEDNIKEHKISKRKRKSI